MAEVVFGTRTLAREWLRTPAMALGQRRPMELLETTEGREVLATLLIQLEYGVYV